MYPRTISNSQLYGSVFKLSRVIELDKYFNLEEESHQEDVHFQKFEEDCVEY